MSDSLSTMSVAAGMSAEQQALYSAQFSRHLLQQKILTVMYFKHQFEDLSAFKLERDKCVRSCYDSEITGLSECAKSCSRPLEDAERYVDNIDFLSLTKLDGCSSSCKTQDRETRQRALLAGKIPIDDGPSSQYSECMWTCYTKLDRRYRGYWKEHLEKLRSRYYGV